MQTNQLKRNLQAGEVQIGTWVHTLGARHLPQILATAGFDFLYIDMEHSSFSLETVASLCSEALYAGIAPLVRPPGAGRHLLSRPIDSGAVGILMPHVDTPEEARAVVEAVKFPPLGLRGSQPPARINGFETVPAPAYMRAANEETMVMLQIESARGVAAIGEILAVEGVDGAVIGRGDLIADLGVEGRDHPEVLAAVDTLIETCQRLGKIPGLLVQSTDEARAFIEKGIRMIAYASETIILRNAARSAIEEIRRSS